MSANTADIFRQVYRNARNFMTPTLIRYGSRGPYHYELSTGEGFDREKIYGVTVIQSISTGYKKRSDLSSCCHSMAEAEALIGGL